MCVCLPTFQVRGPHGGHGGGRGLAEALEGGLLSGGVVRRAVLLFLLLLVGAHGLQGQLFPARTSTRVTKGWPLTSIRRQTVSAARHMA